MRLSEQAASFLFIETPNAPMHSAGISVLSEAPALVDVQRYVVGKLRHQPRYRQRLAYVPFNLAQPVWVDDENFQIDAHVTEHAADGKSLEAALALAAQLNQTLLERRRPLWRMHLITFGGQSLLLHIAHHALLDGVSVGDDAQAFFDLKSDVSQPTEDEWRARPEPLAMELMADAIAENTRSFSTRAGQLQRPNDSQSELLRRATESVTRFVTEPVQTAPWNNGLVGPRREFAHTEMSYADIRRVKRALGGTENDAVLTIVGEAAARYIAETGAGREGMHLRIMCPVRIRREDQHGVRGNRISAVFPVLDAQPANILKRHRQVRWETDGVKQNREAQSLQLLVELAPPLPALPGADWANPSAFGSMFTNMGLNPATFNPLRLLGQLMPQNLGLGLNSSLSQVAGFNLSCVTVPGAQTTQFFAGKEVTQQLVVPTLAGNLGFAVAVSTYARNLTFNFNCDPELLPNLARMVELVEDVTSELISSAHELATA